MKKIAFVMPKFAPGGAEKSLLMLLHMLCVQPDVQVDLILFKNEGLFLKQVPDNVKVVNIEPTLKTAYSPFRLSNCRGKGALVSAVRPVATALARISSKNSNRRTQLRWKYAYKHVISSCPIAYDIACGYLDGEAVYYVVDKINAKKKYGWNQNDYDSLGFCPADDIPYFDRLDNIITLTDECSQILKRNFPDHANKILQIPPIVTADYIRSCANLFVPEEYTDEDGVRFISVGRLVEQKGFDFAIDAAAILKQSGFHFKWYIIGNGILKDALQKQIADRDVADCVILLGERGNPYPYIQHADIFVQPSRFEGKSVILNECKMLCKPILATNYPTVKDQITHGVDGVIVDMQAQAIAEGLRQLSLDKAQQELLSKNLDSTNFDDNTVKQQYAQLLELDI